MWDAQEQPCMHVSLETITRNSQCLKWNIFSATAAWAASSAQKAKATKTQNKQAGKCQTCMLSVWPLRKVALKNTLPFASSAAKYVEPAETFINVIGGCLRDISEVKCEGLNYIEKHWKGGLIYMFTLLTWQSTLSYFRLPQIVAVGALAR